MNGIAINQVDSTKFHGVYIDNKLTWRDQIIYTSKKVSKNKGILSKLKHYLPSNILRMLYQALILPHLNYCSIVWSGTYQSYLDPLNVLQKRVIRHIAHAAPRDHTSHLFKKFNLLKFNDMIRLNIAIFAFKAHNRLLPDVFNNFIVRNNYVHDYNTRHANYAHQHFVRTNFGKFSLRNRSSKVWNALEECIINSPTLSVFKKKIVKDLTIDYY